MRFYTKQHQFYCGIDLHARTMYLCVLNKVNSSLPPVFTTVRRRLSSVFEIKNWRVQRLGRTHGIEIFAEERDLAACRTQEQHILLAIDTPRRLDAPLRLDFGDCAFRIGEGIHPEVEEV